MVYGMIYENIDTFLKEYGHDNVMFCYGNFGMVDFARNLLGSARLVGVDIVFFALDSQSLDALGNEYDVVGYIDDMVHSHAADYGTPEHRRCNWHKYTITNDILASGRTCVYLDLDIVVKHNFEEDLLGQYEGTDYDCLIQCNLPHSPSERYCAGFYSMRPTSRTLGLFSQDELKRSRHLERYRDDQVYFNQYIVPNKLLNIKRLDPDKYPAGLHYYRHPEIDFDCNLIHFNFITKQSDKIAQMRRYGYWSEK